MVTLTEKSEEVLKNLWREFEELKKEHISINELKIDEETLSELVNSESVVVTDEGRVLLTEKGRSEGRDVVRRHRLAERLLVDVFEIKGDLANEAACKFEHILYKGIDDSICSILGHPKFCPHNCVIPSGKCCEEKGSEIKVRIISPLSGLSPGENGVIAYIHSDDQKILQKIIALGVLPGSRVSLIRNFPSFVFQVGNGQFAVDESIASKIFVRVVKN